VIHAATNHFCPWPRSRGPRRFPRSRARMTAAAMRDSYETAVSRSLGIDTSKIALEVDDRIRVLS
jgi:hypothetical protein